MEFAWNSVEEAIEWIINDLAFRFEGLDRVEHEQRAEQILDWLMRAGKSLHQVELMWHNIVLSPREPSAHLFYNQGHDEFLFFSAQAEGGDASCSGQ